MIGIKSKGNLKLIASVIGLGLWLGLSCSAGAIASSYGEISLTNSSKATYLASSGYTTLATSATDFFTVYGSSTKTVKIQKIFVRNTNTSAYAFDLILLIKRSSASSGGTSSTLTAVPLDSNNSAATAQAKIFTANPTPGSAVGTLMTRHLGSQLNLGSQTIADSTIYQGGIYFDADIFGQPIVLRGTSEGIALNLNGITQGGGSPKMDVEVVWTEE